MANLTEHVILNKWDNDINDAIVSVGGDTTGSAGLPDYAKIIKEQLIARGSAPVPTPSKEFILEGDSCIIEADATGSDPYNTEYAIGVKTGLIPGVLYLRICTAVKDIEPVYIDLTRVSEGDVDVDAIVNEVLNTPNFTILQNDLMKVKNDLTEIENQISQIQESAINEEDVTVIVNKLVKSNNDGIDVDELNWD